MAPQPRFILLARIRSAEPTRTGEAVTWLLIGANNRPLGWAGRTFADRVVCLDSAVSLRDNDRLLTESSIVLDPRRRWLWRMTRSNTVLAVSSRAYLRQHECGYSLTRFVEALAQAEVTSTVRTVRGG